MSCYESNIVKYLDDMQIRHGYVGFYYLVDVIDYLLEQDEIGCHGLTKAYRVVAEKRGMAPDSVRFCIRRTLENSERKESTKEFINAAVDRIRVQAALSSASVTDISTRFVSAAVAE